LVWGRVGTGGKARLDLGCMVCVPMLRYKALLVRAGRSMSKTKYT
jgi:hypothetical protein